jgi:uncharacterized protein DUF2344
VDRPSPAPTDPAMGPRAAPARIEPVQRWRVTFAREPVASERVGRVALDEWGTALAASALPIAELGDRPRFAIAAPLPAAARGERELLEVWLLERRPAWEVRERLAPVLPADHRWIDAEDVWLGAPAVVGQVTAADWRIELEAVAPEPGLEGLRAAIDGLNAARAIPRIRLKGTTERRYDLRPLLARVDLADPDGSGHAPAILARTRFHPELGSGRPDEVVGALADAAGIALAIRSMTRTRLLLADERSSARRF